jgi:hypothetical protein
MAMRRRGARRVDGPVRGPKPFPALQVAAELLALVRLGFVARIHKALDLRVKRGRGWLAMPHFSRHVDSSKLLVEK